MTFPARMVNIPLPVEGRARDPERAQGHYNNARAVLRLEIAELEVMEDRGEWSFEQRSGQTAAGLLAVLERAHRAEIAYLIDTPVSIFATALTVGTLDIIRAATGEANYALRTLQQKRIQRQEPNRKWVIGLLNNLDRRLSQAAAAVVW